MLQPLKPGVMVTADVQIVKPLAEGSMGCVWLGRDRARNEQVAVKFMAEEAVADEASRVRFRREVEVSSQLSSPHVVKTFASGTLADGRPYIVMELLEGSSLGDVIEEVGRLDLPQVLPIVQQVGECLSEAHELGFVHRDIKPDNIFLVARPDGQTWVKVLDFGIARRIQEPPESAVTRVGLIVATPEYMSPEQALGSGMIDHRSDLWNLTVVAYVLITGTLPFDGSDLKALVRAIFTGALVPPDDMSLSPMLLAFFRQAFQLEPKARFGSAEELVRAFELAVQETLLWELGALPAEGEPLAATPAAAEPAGSCVPSSGLGAPPELPPELRPTEPDLTEAPPDTEPALPLGPPPAGPPEPPAGAEPPAAEASLGAGLAERLPATAAPVKGTSPASRAATEPAAQTAPSITQDPQRRSIDRDVWLLIALALVVAAVSAVVVLLHLA